MGLQPHAKVILASGSPRRKELLESIGIDFSVWVPEVDETLAPGWSPAEAVEQLAYRKGRAVAEQVLREPSPFAFEPAVSATVNIELPVLVIAADTIVVLDGEVMGKPADAEEACRMLRRLSGRQHEVYSGLAVFCADKTATGETVPGLSGGHSAVPLADIGGYRIAATSPGGKPSVLVGHTVSKVTFGPMTEEEIEAYVKTGEPLDKAGAYGIQGNGAVFIEKIEGDFFSIMGLPLRLLYRMLQALEMRLVF